MLGASVVAVDLLRFSRCMTEGSIGLSSSQLARARQRIAELNSLKPKEGYFFANYSESAGRLYMTDDNARRLDAIRDEIGDPSSKEDWFLLYCLVNAFSRVMNTSGHNVSFLKKFKARALKPLVLKPDVVFQGSVRFVNGDLAEAIEGLRPGRGRSQVLYIDPPYNTRQYGNNYHLYETIVRHDRPRLPPSSKSVCGYRNWQDESKSQFCNRQLFMSGMVRIAAAAKARKMFVSYNTDGIVKPHEFSDSMVGSGVATEVRVHQMPQKRYLGDSKRAKNKSELMELLFEVSLA